MQVEQISTTLASLANDDLEAAIQKVADLGFASIGLLAVKGSRHSIGDLPGFWFDELSAGERANLKALLRPFQRLGLHAPFLDTPLLSYSRHVMATSRQLIRTAIEAAAYFGAETATIHVNTRRRFSLDDDWEALMTLLRDLGDYGALLGVKIGVETGFPPDINTFVRIVREVDHPFVGATIDVGHVAFGVEKALWGTDEGVTKHNDYLAWLCDEIGEKFIHMHIHDVRKSDWRDHRMVGGNAEDHCTIDWPRLFANLKRIDYTGLLELEMEEVDREDALSISKERMIEHLT